MPVVSIGVSAAPALRRNTRLGEVFVSFRRSCYLQTCAGEVLCLADEGLGRGPLTISVRLSEEADLPALGVLEKTPCLLEDDSLRVATLVLELGGVEIWAPIVPSKAMDALLFRRTRELTTHISSLVPPEGLGPLLPHLQTLASGQSLAIDQLAPVSALAATAIQDLTNGLVAGDVIRTEAGARVLLGLGPGLTPSGDDLLVGLLLALHAARSSLAHPLREFVVAHAPVMTGTISESMLKQAALGLGNEASHQLINALFEGQPEDEVLRKVDAVTSVGHTSGWDTLAGIFLGLHLVGMAMP